MDAILTALDSLPPLEIEAVRLYQQRLTNPPDAESLAKAAEFMQTLHETCEKLAQTLSHLPPVPVRDSAQVAEFPL